MADRRGAGITLTDDLLRRLTSEGRQQLDVIDAGFGMRGGDFGVRVSLTGRKTWFVRYRNHSRRRRRLKLGTYPLVSLSKARDQAQKELAKAALGSDPQKERRERRQAGTFAEVATIYLERYASELASAAEKRRTLDIDILPFWRHERVEDITRRMVVEIVERPMKRGAPSQTLKVRNLVLSILDVAVERGYIELNPARSTKPPKGAKSKARDRVLSADELRAVWLACEDYWPSSPTGFGIRLLMVTLQRRSEVNSMEAAEVNRPWWTVPAAKTKKRRATRVFLSPIALDQLDELERLGGGGKARWFLPTQGTHSARARQRGHIHPSTITVAAARIARDLGFHFTPHDLRRTGITNLAEMGCPHDVREAILNHAPKGVESTHYNLYDYDREKREWMLAWSRRLEAIVRGQAEPSNVVRIG